MYGELADWFHVLTPPHEYAEEALEIAVTIDALAAHPVGTLLELGSGGGNNASLLKQRYDMTLVDLSPQMLATSRTINPELEHIEGDMRTVRLGRTFDAVLIHDALMHMTTLDDLRSAIETAAAHLRPGGVALFGPDDTTQTYVPTTTSGGDDSGDRAMRYLEWTHDPEPGSSVVRVTFVYVLRDGSDPVHVLHEEFAFGLFPHATWMQLIENAGMEARSLPSAERTLGGVPRPLFAGLHP